MRTRPYLIANIDELIATEEKEIFNAPSTDNFFYKTNIALLNKKIDGLKALKVAISSVKHRNDEPSQEWLKQTIILIVRQHPALIDGINSRTKKLLQNIAPGWSESPPVASSNQTLPSPDINLYAHTYKIALIGDNGVGKSSTLLQLSESKFPDHFISTIGGNFKCKKIDGITLEIWDSPQGWASWFDKRVSSPYRNDFSYFKNNRALVLMFDVSNQETFGNLERWIEAVKSIEEAKRTRIFVVGNKIDLVSERKVSMEDAKKLTSQLNLPYIEISAKDNISVNDLFRYVAYSIKTCLEGGSETLKNYEEDVEGLEEKSQPKGMGGGCSIS